MFLPSGDTVLSVPRIRSSQAIISVLDGRRYPSQRDSIISDYRRECGLEDSVPYAGDTHLAMDGDRVLGFISYRGGRIDALYSADDSPGETSERLLRSFTALKMNEGLGQVSIHSLDRRGDLDVLCRRMGFTEDGLCNCCQRDGAVCLRMRFRSPDRDSVGEFVDVYVNISSGTSFSPPGRSRHNTGHSTPGKTPHRQQHPPLGSSSPHLSNLP